MRQPVIGVFGGGQLGDMFTDAAQRKLGAQVAVWTPQADDPALKRANLKIIAPFDDEKAFRTFTQSVDTVTLEFENVPVSLLKRIRNETRIPVRPGPGVLEVAQDRWEEKKFFERKNIPCTKTREIYQAKAYSGFNPKLDPLFSYPAILKTSRNGYDGKGQRLVHNNEELLRAWIEFGRVHCVLENPVPFEFELSVIAARDVFGDTMLYPPIVNEHRDGILRRSTCPSALITPAVETQAKGIARSIAEELNLIGIVAVEMFVVRDPKTGEYTVLANEIAPRPHNSGHGTIEACAVSQYEQLAHLVLGEPVRPAGLRHGFVMENLIGSEIEKLKSLDPTPNVFAHDYGKSAVREGRKMGHITTLTD